VSTRTARARRPTPALFTPQVVALATPGDYLCESTTYRGFLMHAVHLCGPTCLHDGCRSSCDCTGFHYHGHCHHLDAVRAFARAEDQQLLWAVCRPMLEAEGYIPRAPWSVTPRTLRAPDLLCYVPLEEPA
jgi:hypothetical protein